MATPCILTPVDEPICTFRAAHPAKVTLEIKSVTGLVTFDCPNTTYDSKPVQCNATSTQISFTVVSGQKNLDVVYIFSDGATGAGELHEVCDNNTLLAFVNAPNTFVRYVICCP